jgi:hypothetical protein
MLRKFSVSGYKNFNEETTLDLTQVREYGFNRECIVDGLLGKILIMGPNGSGKSNLGYALFDIVYTLTDKPPSPPQVDRQSFINGEGNAETATFKYEFQHGDSIINYEYRKSSPYKLTYEKLSVDGKMVIEIDRKEGSVTLSDASVIGVERLIWDGLSDSLSMIRYIANNTVQSRSPITFLMDFVDRMLYFKSIQDGNMSIGLERAGDDIESYMIKNGLVKGFERFLRENA